MPIETPGSWRNLEGDHPPAPPDVPDEYDPRLDGLRGRVAVFTGPRRLDWLRELVGDWDDAEVEWRHGRWRTP